MAQAENAVMYAVEQICGLYGVQYTREQSRVLKVESRGRWRPMYFGTWVDDLGKKHTGGKADFLLRPRVRLTGWPSWIAVPLWVECKIAANVGKNRKTMFEQMQFRQWVEKNGDYYLTIEDDARPLLAWLDTHGVVKHCDDVALATVLDPIDASQLHELPCKHCGFSRVEHTKPAFGCPLHLAACNTKLIGKVWSPDLRKGANLKNGKATVPGNIGAGTERN